jgi:hypothetical protein
VAQKDLKAVELLARILTMMVDQKELVHMLEELIFLFLHPFFSSAYSYWFCFDGRWLFFKEHG